MSFMRKDLCTQSTWIIESWRNVTKCYYHMSESVVQQRVLTTLRKGEPHLYWDRLHLPAHPVGCSSLEKVNWVTLNRRTNSTDEEGRGDLRHRHIVCSLRADCVLLIFVSPRTKVPWLPFIKCIVNGELIPFGHWISAVEAGWTMCPPNNGAKNKEHWGSRESELCELHLWKTGRESHW